MGPKSTSGCFSCRFILFIVLLSCNGLTVFYVLFLFQIFQAHQDVLKKLVDLIGFTSIMEVSDLYPSLGSAYYDLSTIFLFLSNLFLLT